MHKVFALQFTLHTLFSSGHLNQDDAIAGYDIYSSTIADVLSDPALRTPITVGLYAKWGSGKSFLIDKLQSKFCNYLCYTRGSESFTAQ